MKHEFNKGDLIKVQDRAAGDTPKAIMGFVIGFHAHATYNRFWYDVHLADGRTLRMLNTGIKKVNNG